jgi:hypothetical protein
MDEPPTERARTPKLAQAMLAIPFIVALVLFAVDRL